MTRSCTYSALTRARSIQPLPDLPVLIQRHTLPSKRPAHVAHADEIRRRQTIQHADLRAKQSRLAAETQRADAEFVRGPDDVLFELVEFRIRIAIVEFAQELLFREFVTGRAIAADAYAENAWPTTFTLRLQHRIE